MSKVILTTDISRQLKSENYSDGATLSIDIPRDSVFKHLQISMSGSVVTTFASGTPVADDVATMQRIVSSIEVISNGSFTIKNVTPWMMFIQSLIATGNPGVRRSSAGAAAVANPTVDAKFTYGTTTQVTSVVEGVLISFENVLAGKGRMDTLFNTRGLSSAVLKIQCGAMSNLLGYGNTAPVVYSSNLLKFEVETTETQNIPQQAVFSIFKQTQKSIGFTAQASDELLDIERGNYLQGLMFQVRDGAAGSTTTATGRVLSNDLLTTIKLIINGTNFVQNTTFKSLQNKNRLRFGINAPMVSNKSLFDGHAYMDLLTPREGEKFGALATAQNVQAPAVDLVQVALSTSSAATYTATAKVTIGTNSIVKPAKQG